METSRFASFRLSSYYLIRAQLHFKISITDSGPKIMSLGTATSNGFKTFDIRVRAPFPDFPISPSAWIHLSLHEIHVVM